MAIYKLTFFASMGGRSATSQYSNVFLFRSPADINSVALQTLAEQLAAKLATVTVASARILRATINTIGADGRTGKKRGTHKTIPVDAVGARAVPAGVDPAILEFTAIFKKSATSGFPGQMKLRGCFLETEVQSSADLAPALKADVNTAPFTALAQDIIGIFTANNATLILPAPDGENWEAGARPVSRVVFQGVGLQQRRNARRSAEQKRKEAAKADLAELARAYAKAVLEAGGAELIGVAVRGILMATARQILSRYGIGVLTAVGIPLPVRALVLAAAEAVN